MFSIAAIQLITAIFLVCYIPRILCWFASFKQQKKLVNHKKNKLALVIPARNEGETIIPLLKSIKRQTYSTENFDVFIIVKEKDDPVHEYAKMINAKVYVDEKQTSKGDCLDYGFKTILAKFPNKYDGYILVDADCILEDNFIEEMNNSMLSGADIINAKKLVKNYYEENQKNVNLVTSCNGLIWTLMDDMGNRWKSDHGLTTMTVTTGILFSKKIMQEWGGWNYRSTLTEDMELQRDCTVKGYKTFYYSHAKIYMEESPILSETNKRRSRWMNGLINADFIYAEDMLKKHSFKSLADNYFIFSLWIVYVYIALLLIIGVGSLAFSVFSVFSGNGFLHFFETGMLALSMVYLSFFIMTFVAILVDWDNIKLNNFGKLALLFVHPLFYMEYIRIVASTILIRKPMQWDEIKRLNSDPVSKVK